MFVKFRLKNSVQAWWSVLQAWQWCLHRVYLPSYCLGTMALGASKEVVVSSSYFFPSPWPPPPQPTPSPFPLFVWNRVDLELFWCLCLSDAASARITDFFTKTSFVWCWGWSQDLIPARQALYLLWYIPGPGNCAVFILILVFFSVGLFELGIDWQLWGANLNILLSFCISLLVAKIFIPNVSSS